MWQRVIALGLSFGKWCAVISVYFPRPLKAATWTYVWTGRPKPWVPHLWKTPTPAPQQEASEGELSLAHRALDWGCQAREESESSGHPPGFVYSGHTDSCWTKQERRKEQGMQNSAKSVGPSRALLSQDEKAARHLTVLEQGFLNSTHSRTVVTREYFIWL